MTTNHQNLKDYRSSSMAYSNDMNFSADMNATMFNDVTRSVDQLCNQMSLANMNIPKLASYDDIHEFLVEYELATTGLSNERQVQLLNRAFHQSRYRAWFETELKPLIKNNESWSTIKNKIVQRFSHKEERDRHFRRLREMKFKPDEGKLLDYVEEMLYSYSKAYPNDKDDESKLRYIKATLPSNVESQLLMDAEYRKCINADTLKAIARRYDERPESGSSSLKNQANDMSKLLQELVISIKKQTKDNEETRKAVVAAVQGHSSYARSSRSPQRNPSSDHRSSRDSTPSRNRYQTPSPRPVKRDSFDLNRRSSSNNEKQYAFSSEMYWNQVGKPPRACRTCGFWHWDQHCQNNLDTLK